MRSYSLWNRQNDRGAMVLETEYFPVWFVSSLAIRQDCCVLRLPKRKNLLVSGRRFLANSVYGGGLPDRRILAYAERRATKPTMTLFSRKNRCTPIALSKQKRMKKRPAAAERGNIPHLSVAPQDLAPYGVIATGCRTSSGLFPPSLLIRLFTCPPDTIARLSGFVNR